MDEYLKTLEKRRFHNHEDSRMIDEDFLLIMQILMTFAYSFIAWFIFCSEWGDFL